VANQAKKSSTLPLDWKEVYYTNQLPSRIRQQCRSGIGLDQRGVEGRPAASPTWLTAAFKKNSESKFQLKSTAKYLHFGR
jgi:hypothetical protein